METWIVRILRQKRGEHAEVSRVEEFNTEKMARRFYAVFNIRNCGATAVPAEYEVAEAPVRLDRVDAA